MITVGGLKTKFFKLQKFREVSIQKHLQIAFIETRKNIFLYFYKKVLHVFFNDKEIY